MGQRILVIGNSGGGKSRLASGLARSLKLPLFRIDSLLWNPGWIPTPEEKFRQQHDAIVAQSQWIIDGVASWSSVAHRISRCDTVVYVDLPLRTHYWWAAKRQFWCLFKPRPDFVEGCPMLPKTRALAKMMWSLHKTLRPKMYAAIAGLGEGKCSYILRSRDDVNGFYERYCK